MKFIAMKFQEKQAECFLKREINWHVSSVVVRQDWFSVLSVLENIFVTIKLRNSGTKKAFLRSDEAGSYHNSKLVSSLRGLGYQDCHFQLLTQLWVYTRGPVRLKRVHLASLCSIMGKECLQILWNLSLTAEQQATVKGCLDGLEAHFKPQRNVVYERYVFNSCVQIAEESVDVYVNRLRKLASSCEFGALTNELIRDRLVIGVKDRDLKGLSLQKAIEICKSNEITKQQLKSLENEEKKPHGFWSPSSHSGCSLRNRQ